MSKQTKTICDACDTEHDAGQPCPHCNITEPAYKQGFNAVAAKPHYAPRNPYNEDTQPDMWEAWENGAMEAGICSSYTNGVLDK